MRGTNNYGVLPGLLAEMRDLLRGSGEFNPLAFHNKALDILTVQNRDCSVLEEPIPGTNFAILKDVHTGKVIGINIYQWSEYL